jgi:Tol biopolymer transport system component
MAEEFAWSPDGARVAFHSRRDGQWRIYVLSWS